MMSDSSIYVHFAYARANTLNIQFQCLYTKSGESVAGLVIRKKKMQTTLFIFVRWEDNIRNVCFCSKFIIITIIQTGNALVQLNSYHV